MATGCSFIFFNDLLEYANNNQKKKLKQELIKAIFLTGLGNIAIEFHKIDKRQNMKRMKQICFMLILAFPMVVTAQNGKVYDKLSMHSEILKMDRKYAIYLPPGYETSERTYPILYLLHGAGDDNTGWIQAGEVAFIADKSIIEGTSTPMIIVMPDASGELKGYLNRPEKNWNYEDFFIQEFMPFIEKTYRIKSRKRFRAIAGLSMGGGGSFYYALHHPELFSSACPLSANCGPITIDNPWSLLGSKRFRVGKSERGEKRRNSEENQRLLSC